MPASLVAVIGPGDATPAEVRVAEEVGAGLAAAGCSVVCGGLGGVMAAACRGAREAGAGPPGVRTVGLLPGLDPAAANPWVDVAIPTGLGEGRNLLVARAGQAVVAIGGAYGTLSEIALALRAGTPVVGIATWELRHHDARDDGITVAATAQEAVALVRSALR